MTKTTQLNEFGFRVGTKRDAACDMFKAGAKMSEVKDAIGSSFYNLLIKLANDGHKVIKSKTDPNDKTPKIKIVAKEHSNEQPVGPTRLRNRI